MNTTTLIQRLNTPSFGNRIARRTRAFFSELSTKRILATLSLWSGRQRQRRQLSELDARQLADMGISMTERNAETVKVFWEK